MNKDVKYNGYSAVPSDYECQDGELAMSLNLLNEDGQLKPLSQPIPTTIGLSASQKAAYIHETSSYKHYILLEGKKVSWLNDPTKSEGEQTPVQLVTFTGSVEIYQFSSIGNTLLVLCSDGMHYFLWKGDTSAYLNLGTTMPECSLSFGLQGEMKRTDEFEISYSIHKDNIYSEFDDTQKASITNQVLAKINKFIAEESTQKGKFIFPFFVRYAYRLYDGSLTRHSAPILMICSSENTPRVFWFNLHGEDKTYTSARLRVVAPVHSLDYALHTNLDSLKNWSDIIKSVDIFISKPIYTYDQNGKCERFINGGEDLSSFSVCKHINQAASSATYPLRYQYNNFGKLYAFTFTPDALASRPGGVLVTPKRSADAVKEDIRNCSQFYFLHSIRVDELKSERTLIPVKEDYLQSLVTREVMSDDYDSHDKIIPSQAFAYNSRLNLSGVKKQLFQGFDGYSLFNFSDGYVMNWADASPTTLDRRIGVMVAVYIKQDGKDIVVYGSGGSCGYNTPLLFFYYPNINAYKAVIIRTDYIDMPHLVVNLEPHGFLNGAFYFGGWEEPTGIPQGRPQQSNLADRTIDVFNKVYTSEVNNPYIFPVLGINTVGTGKIMAISTAAKALSEGQFGQFPLYAFTDEGVWALEVSSTGSYSARQPITRDVILENTDPLQMDSAVLFATDRGIMLISGSQTQCISDVINSNEPFDIRKLPGMDKLHAMLGHDADTCLPTVPFLDFISECGMLYDYVHQRVIVYNPKYTYAYVYSLKSRAWGMMYSSIEAGINSYPEALAVDHDGALLNFSAMDGKATKGLAVTRPLNLDAVNIHKTIDSIIQRGNFAKGNVKSVLYGSRDLINWHLVWSSKDHYLRGFRGTPYKYFRIALLCDLAPGESIYGASVQFTPRLTNQPR